jgi:hypothetical protein
MTARYPVIPFTSGRLHALSLVKWLDVAGLDSLIPYTLMHSLPRVLCTTLYGYPWPVYDRWRPALPQGFEPQLTAPETVVLPITPWENKLFVFGCFTIHVLMLLAY